MQGGQKVTVNSSREQQYIDTKESMTFVGSEFEQLMASRTNMLLYEEEMQTQSDDQPKAMQPQSRVEVFRKTPSKIGGDDSAVGVDPSSKDINERADE